MDVVVLSLDDETSGWSAWSCGIVAATERCAEEDWTRFEGVEWMRLRGRAFMVQGTMKSETGW